MRLPLAKLPARFLLGALLSLCGCQLMEKEQADAPIVLHLTLHDSLSKFDNVVVVVADGVDTARVIDTLWPNRPLPAPSQIPSRTLNGVKDPFLVKVRGYRSAGQLAVETLIFYEAGKKRVVQTVLPPVIPVNTLARLTPSAGGTLEPPFSADVLNYNVMMADKVPNVSFDVIPTYTNKAIVVVAGDTVKPGVPAKVFTVGTTNDTVPILVTDLGVTRIYRVVIVPPKALRVEVARMEHSVGTLDPAFSPSGDMFNLVVPSTVGSVDLRFWPADPSNQVLYYMGQQTFPGTTKTVVLAKPGDSTVLTVVVRKAGLSKEYVFFVSRARNP